MSKKENNKKIGKKIIVWLTVIVCTVLTVCVAGLAYIFLVSGSELFGIVYATNRRTLEYEIENYNISELKCIEINTTRYDVYVLASDNDSEIRAYVKNDISGLVKKKNVKTELNYFFDIYAGSLKLTLTEMKGWVSEGESRLTVVVPSDMWTQNLNIKIGAKKSARATINGLETDDEAQKSALGELSVKNNHGAISFDNLIINKLSINTSSAEIYAGKNITGKINLAEISMKNGTLNFMDAGNASEILNTEGKGVDDVDFTIIKMVLNKVGKKGKINLVKVQELVSGEGVELNGGNCYVKNLSFFSIKSANFNLNVDKLNYYVNSVSEFRASKDGACKIGEEANSSVNIVTKNGAININGATDTITAESQNGNITIKNAMREVSVINVNGDTRISFGEDVPQFNELSKYRCVSSARIKSGKLVVEGLNKINLTVDEGGKGKIELKFDKLIGQNTLNVGEASLLLVAPESEPYELKFYPNNSNADIGIGTVTLKEKKTSEQFFRYVFCESGGSQGNTLEVSSSGKVLMYSENVFNQLRGKLKCEI